MDSGHHNENGQLTAVQPVEQESCQGANQKDAQFAQCDGWCPSLGQESSVGESEYGACVMVVQVTIEVDQEWTCSAPVSCIHFGSLSMS